MGGSPRWRGPKRTDGAFRTVDDRPKRTAALWELFCSYHGTNGTLAPIDAELLSARMPDIEPLFRGDGDVVAMEAHSGRCAWLHRPWSDAHGAYPGFEYKGVGHVDGRRAAAVDTGAYVDIVGCQRLDWAIEEYETSSRLWRAGVPAQRPLAVFAVDLDGVPVRAGLLVRTSVSAIRVSDLWRLPSVWDAYLRITKLTVEEHATRLGRRLGTGLRIAVDSGTAHPVVADNVSSEGELMDFEHLWNGWYYGAPVPSAYVVEAVRTTLREFTLVLGEAAPHFEAAFCGALCDMPLADGDLDSRAMCYTSALVGAALPQGDMLVPVSDAVRAELLTSWGVALASYRALQADAAGLRERLQGAPLGRNVLDNLDVLIAMTEDDIDRMKMRPEKDLAAIASQ